MECETSVNPKKRVLKKVRSRFLHKKPEENSAQDIDPTTRCLSTGTVHQMVPSIGLVEVDRKICTELRFIQFRYDISTIDLNKTPLSSSVTINFKINPEYLAVPWEYTIKRLESYGDLNLATWAHIIKNYYAQGPGKLYSKRFEMMMNETRERAALTCETFESQYPYHKGIFLTNETSTELLSVSWNESFLKEMGHTSENFMERISKDGLQPMSPQDSAINRNFGKVFLNYVLGKCQPIQEEPDFVAYLYNKDGTVRKCVLQNYLIMYPAPEGIYFISYYILKKEKENTGFSNRLFEENPGLKFKKIQDGSSMVKGDKDLE